MLLHQTKEQKSYKLVQLEIVILRIMEFRFSNPAREVSEVLYIYKSPPIDCKLSNPENETNEFKELELGAIISKYRPMDCKLSKPENEVKEFKEL